VGVTIEYCGTCNYRPLAARLAQAITAGTGRAVELVHSTTAGAFEVACDGRLVFSKNLTNRFPDPAEVVDAIRAGLRDDA
jgi:selT/selW/selH-like putative selenoprotein